MLSELTAPPCPRPRPRAFDPSALLLPPGEGASPKEPLVPARVSGQPWVNLEDVMLNEMSVTTGQVLHDAACTRHLVKIEGQEVVGTAARGRERGKFNGETFHSGRRRSFWSWRAAVLASTERAGLRTANCFMYFLAIKEL